MARRSAPSTTTPRRLVARHLDAGRTVAVISEGDPLFYGSYMHLHVRLAPRYRTEIVPGVTGDVRLLVGGRRADRAGRRRVHGAARDAAGGRAGAPPRGRRRRRGDEARPPSGKGAPRARAGPDASPRRSMSSAGPWRSRSPCRSPTSATTPRRTSRSCWCPAGRSGRDRRARGRRARSGRPGRADAGGCGRARDAPTRSTATVPISTACRRGRASAPRLRQPRGGRARRGGARATRRRARRSRWCPAAIPACSPWRRRSASRSTAATPSWRDLDVAVVPGVTAMLAVAARVGAPLGHDFCAISLSDNLKPWAVVERRLDAAAGAGFVIALYNPISRARPWQLGAAFERLRGQLPPSTPVVFGRAVGRERESVSVINAGSRRSVRRRHGDADHRRLGADARDRAAGPGAAGLHAAVGPGRQRMIEPCHGLLDGFDRPARRAAPAAAA